MESLDSTASMADATSPSRFASSSDAPTPPDQPIASRIASFLHDHRRAVFASTAALMLGGAVAAFAVVDDGGPVPTARRISEELAAPDTHAQLEALASRADVFLTEQRIRRGDTIGTLLTRLGVADGDAEAFLRSSPSARALAQLKPGRLVSARVDEDGALQWLRYAHSTSEGRELDAAQNAHSLVIERRGDAFSARDEATTNERRVELASGEIRTSLFAATDAANLPDGIATQIAEIFSGGIDFYHDLRRGDRFRLVYESYYQNGEFVRAGRILAIEFVNAGKAHSALWYPGSAAPGGAASVDGDAPIAGHYYGFDGHSLRRAFLRTPLAFTRISSGFGGRVHPISNVWKQHTGVDFAAPIGTPVRTTADGVVDFAGVKNGYGNVVVIRHQGVYSTLYGHLSQFAAGLKRGQRIEQGHLIGYVGMTGWATGPHLHYEFRVSDHATNPLTAVLPDAPPIGRGEITAFRNVAGEFDRQLALLRASEGVPVTASAGGAGSGPLRTVVARGAEG